jgi:hypothetical protein
MALGRLFTTEHPILYKPGLAIKLIVGGGGKQVGENTAYLPEGRDHELSAFQKEPAKFSKTSFVVSILLSTNHGHGSDVRTGVIVGGLSNKKCTQVVVAGSVVDNNPCFWDATFQR